MFCPWLCILTISVPASRHVLSLKSLQLKWPCNYREIPDGINIFFYKFLSKLVVITWTYNISISCGHGSHNQTSKRIYAWSILFFISTDVGMDNNKHYNHNCYYYHFIFLKTLISFFCQRIHDRHMYLVLIKIRIWNWKHYV